MECESAAQTPDCSLNTSKFLNLSSMAILYHNGLHLYSNHRVLEEAHCLPASHYVTHMQRDFAVLLLYFVWGTGELLMITRIEAHIFGPRSALEVEGVSHRFRTHMLFLLTHFQSYRWLSVVEFKKQIPGCGQHSLSYPQRCKTGKGRRSAMIWWLSLSHNCTGYFSFSGEVSWLV